MPTLEELIAGVAPVTTGMTVGQVIDAALGVVDPQTLKTAIDMRKQETVKAAAVSAIPTVPTPANAAAIYSYILGTAAEPSYADAYLALKRVAQGATASPPTATWFDVWAALLYLPLAVRAATPHLEDL